MYGIVTRLTGRFPQLVHHALLQVVLTFALGCADDVHVELAAFDSGADVGRGDAPPQASEDTEFADIGPADMGSDASQLVPLRDDALPWAWLEIVETTRDRDILNAHFAQVGYQPPAGAAVWVAEVLPGAGFARYVFYEGAAGGYDMAFWPASTIKVLSALGALEWVAAQGHSVDAQITWDSGFSDRLGDIVDRAIRVSSNIDYDRTLRAAGWDFMNATFLTPERGFPRTVITGSYASVEVRNPPGYTLAEGGKSTYVAARTGTGDYGRNDTNLFELVEGIRRITLHDEIPPHEQFRISAADRATVVNALCAATPSYLAAGVEQVLGPSEICHKPGWVPDNECLDHGLVIAASGRRFLVGASVPYSANCPGLTPLVRHALQAVVSNPGVLTPVGVQADFGEVIVQREDGGITVGVNASSLAVWLNGRVVEAVPAGPGRFSIDTVEPQNRILIAAFLGDEMVAYRAATF